MLQEQSLELPLRPEVHGIGQKLGGHCVYPQEVSHKHHSLDFLENNNNNMDVRIEHRLLLLAKQP